MAKINLLPWRAELRKQRQKQFNTLLGGAGVVGVLIGFMIVMYYNGQIEGQEARNRYLVQQIAEVEIKLKEIDALDRKRASLIKRKEVIEELQSSRSQMVHLFDELVRTIPEGVKLTSVKQAGVVLTLEGRAQSNARVATYMRNLDSSGWMAGPDVSVIEARGADSQLPFAFSLKVNLKTPNKQADVEAGGSP